MEKLTVKEKEILEELVQGKTNAEMAEKIGYSERYIKKMLQNLQKKFKVENRIKLVVAYIYTKLSKYV